MAIHPATPSNNHLSWLNTIVHFLARRDIEALTYQALHSAYVIPQVDLLILLGNSSLFVAEQAANVYRNGLAKELMICGGIGHSTQYLATNIRQHPIYHSVPVNNRPEADMLKDVFVKYWNIEEKHILVENQSANCGANAIEAHRLLTQTGKNPKTILLLQDPILQCRTHASFQKVWQSKPVTLISYASFIPLLEIQDNTIICANSVHTEFCDTGRLLSLIMGEIPRLQNTETGYGPKGKNFIAAVDIPDKVTNAYHALAPFYAAYIR